MRTMAVGAAALALLLAGCGSPEREQTQNLEDVDTLGEDTAGVPDVDPGAGLIDETPLDTLGSTPPAEITADGGEAVMATPEDEGGALPDWTIGRIDVRSTATRPPVRVTGIRPGRHPEFDRIVFDLGGEGTGLPGYALEYVDRPLHECGSGEEVYPVGDAWLSLRLEPAAGHTEAGEALVGRAPVDPGLPQILRIYRTCDFEAVVEFVMAVRSPEPFRAFHLTEPRRVVVDIRR